MSGQEIKKFLQLFAIEKADASASVAESTPQPPRCNIISKAHFNIRRKINKDKQHCCANGEITGNGAEKSVRGKNH